MIKITQCKILAKEDSPQAHINYLSKLLHRRPEELQTIKIIKRSIDARKKPDVYYVYSFLVKTTKEELILNKNRKNANITAHVKSTPFHKRIQRRETQDQVVVVGAGPSGLFAAYYLALSGYCPVIIERGSKMDKRKIKVEEFWNGKGLDGNTNVSFGEGGAGTFSDGKLNTGVKDKTGRIPFVLKTLIRFGADESIAYDAKPHIGTDCIQQVIVNLRNEICELGGKFYFETTFSECTIENGKIVGVSVMDNESGVTTQLPATHCIMAIGHSARDTFSYLYKAGVTMEPKSFAVGVRVEHLQEKVNLNQYGDNSLHLPAADYKITAKTTSGRGVYTFCMCPGGFVVDASTEDGHLVVNGMSNRARNERNANSAVVVTVTPDDFLDKSPLGGIAFQKTLEQAAFNAGNGKVPVQKYGDFKENRPSTSYAEVTPNVKGGTMLCNVRNLLPDYIAETIIEGMTHFGKQMDGFDHDDTLVLGVETRTSSPLRILRDEQMVSNIQGLYPCGEGAGYAGGIMSAAVDGLKVAETISQQEEMHD